MSSRLAVTEDCLSDSEFRRFTSQLRLNDHLRFRMRRWFGATFAIQRLQIL
jgi:hypothetical protein